MHYSCIHFGKAFLGADHGRGGSYSLCRGTVLWSSLYLADYWTGQSKAYGSLHDPQSGIGDFCFGRMADLKGKPDRKTTVRMYIGICSGYFSREGIKPFSLEIVDRNIYYFFKDGGKNGLYKGISDDEIRNVFQIISRMEKNLTGAACGENKGVVGAEGRPVQEESK